ncbi:hypothetical protein DCC62_07275 [candidate division KSB1 bacterium]|nr:MAG: hypothetical protein DCC62_07275 [candidate division KSB1 bacterium]
MKILGEVVFIDTNVWVARMFADHPFHERARERLNELVQGEKRLGLSSQIIREIISVCTLGRNLSRAMAWEELRMQLDPIFSQTIFLNETEFSAKLLIELGQRLAIRGKQIHDTNIVAVMLAHEVPRLVTFNPDDFKRFDEIELIVP